MLKLHRPSADKTRNIVLKTATRLFAKQGFAGTSIRDIAYAAKINQNLIYHHYHNKEGLWKAVRHGIIEQFDRLYNSNILLKSKNLESFLYTLATSLFTFLNHHPELLRILNWHRLEARQQSFKLERSIHSLRWQAILADFQEKGQLRRDLDLNFALFAITSAVQNALENAAIFSQDNSLAKRKKYLKFAITNLYQILKN